MGHTLLPLLSFVTFSRITLSVRSCSSPHPHCFSHTHTFSLSLTLNIRSRSHHHSPSVFRLTSPFFLSPFPPCFLFLSRLFFLFRYCIASHPTLLPSPFLFTLLLSLVTCPCFELLIKFYPGSITARLPWQAACRAGRRANGGYEPMVARQEEKELVGNVSGISAAGKGRKKKGGTRWEI